MNKRFVGVLTFAFLVAAGASLVLYRVLISRPASAKPATAMAHVVLATKDLEVGTVLKEEDVKLSEWPGALPLGAATEPKLVLGRGVTTAIYAKEPIVETRLAAKGAGGGMAAMIPPGWRAVAVRVNEVVGVAGFVVPGMHVDVLISGNTPGGNGSQGTLTQTLLQNIEVLSAGTNIEHDAEGKPANVKVVNLLVTPEQAELLSLAANNQTHIQLALRNPTDHQEVKTPGSEMANLFGTTAAKPAPRVAAAARPAAPPAAPKIAKPEPPPTFVVQVINGAKATEQKFQMGEVR